MGGEGVRGVGGSVGTLISNRLVSFAEGGCVGG